MDLLKSHKRRSRISELVYIALNLGLAATLLIVVLFVQSPWLAIAIVLLSKWRSLAVRPRFWFANLVANMVDVIVGVSTVVLMYAAGAAWIQVGLAVLYAVWLLFIKPRSRRSFVALQAGTAVFFGISALSVVSYSWDSVFFVLAMWVIGYSSARHVLGSYDEAMTSLYSLIAGLFFAELGWISFHWLFAYTIPGLGSVMLSQLALFTILCCFVAERAYVSYHKHGVVRGSDVLLPSLLASSVILILVLFFDSLSTTGSV